MIHKYHAFYGWTIFKECLHRQKRGDKESFVASFLSQIFGPDNILWSILALIVKEEFSTHLEFVKLLAL